MIKKRFISMLVLLMTAVTGAWAETKVYDSGEVDLRTLQTGDILMAGVTLTRSNSADDVTTRGNRFSKGGQIKSMGEALANYPLIIGENGVINNKNNGEDSTTDYTPIDENSEVGNAWVVLYIDAPSYRDYKGIYIAGIKYSTTPAASTYTVTLKEGTDDADNWTITPAEATTTGVAAGTEVKATYGGAKKVKSVKAVKKAKPAATVTTAPTAKTGVKAGEDVAIVNEGTAEGGTMMYMVNATQPASTDGFSATVPTAEGLTAGTYYVWYYVKADDSHTDSEISDAGIEVTIAAAETTVTWTSSDMPSNFYAQFDGWTYNNTHQGITVTASGDAQGGWSQNYINVNEGSGTITFTSSVGNIKSIVITAENMNNIDEWHVPTGWTINNPWDNPRTLSWNGTASTTVDLPLADMQNISGISTIVFTLE